MITRSAASLLSRLESLMENEHRRRQMLKTSAGVLFILVAALLLTSPHSSPATPRFAKNTVVVNATTTRSTLYVALGTTIAFPDRQGNPVSVVSPKGPGHLVVKNYSSALRVPSVTVRRPGMYFLNIGWRTASQTNIRPIEIVAPIPPSSPLA